MFVSVVFGDFSKILAPFRESRDCFGKLGKNPTKIHKNQSHQPIIPKTPRGGLFFRLKVWRWWWSHRNQVQQDTSSTSSRVVLREKTGLTFPFESCEVLEIIHPKFNIDTQQKCLNPPGEAAWRVRCGGRFLTGRWWLQETCYQPGFLGYARNSGLKFKVTEFGTTPIFKARVFERSCWGCPWVEFFVRLNRWCGNHIVNACGFWVWLPGTGVPVP